MKQSAARPPPELTNSKNLDANQLKKAMIQSILNNTIYRYSYKPLNLKLCWVQLHTMPPIYNPQNPNARRWFWTLYWRGKVFKFGLL